MNYKEFEMLKKYSEASGISSVVDNNIEMKLNEFGFYEEVVKNPKKFNDEKIKNVNINFNTTTDESVLSKELFGNIKGIKHDSRTGYYLQNYIGYVSEGNYRENASSGGIGSWILSELLNKDMIDYAIHVKKSSKENLLFEYGISASLEDIQEGSGTKYYPVELSSVIKTVLTQPGRYAVIGIPSFISEIRLLQKNNPIIKERIVFTVGLICGHQKSSKFADFMAWQSGILPENLTDINFRVKLPDKPSSLYGISVTGKINGKPTTVITPKNKLQAQDWGQGHFKKYSSDFVDDVMNETADITLGDAWLDEYTNDFLGNNIIVVRNPKIFELLENANNENRLQLEKVSVEKINESQDGHFRHTQEELKYRLFKKDRDNEWRPKKRVEPSENLSKKRKNIQDLRENISQTSHVAFQEAIRKNNILLYEKSLRPFVQKYNSIYRRNAFKKASFISKIKIIIKKILRK